VSDKNSKAKKGDPKREQRLEQALRANLMKRKARERAVASNNEAQAQARGRKAADEGGDS
jgi:hypothetical protein